MAATPSNVNSAEFTIVQLAGADDYGTQITNPGLNNWVTEEFDQDASGLLVPLIPPAQITQEPPLEFGGFLNNLNDNHLVGMAINASGSPSYNLANTVVPITIGYGRHTTASTGWETTGCFATRLNITGREKQLAQFSASLVGLVTDVATLTLDTTPTMPEFYPMPKATFALGTTFDTAVSKTTTLIDFALALNTGYTPQTYSDGNQYYGNVCESKKVCDLTLTMAYNATSLAEWVKYDARNPSCAQIVLTSTGGSSTVTIQVFGYYLNNWRWERREGKQALVGTLRGYWDLDGAVYEAFEITPA